MLVTVAQFFDPMEAHIVRARLEAEDIPATVAHDQHVTANWPLSVALGGVRVQVPADCAEPAQALLAAYHRGELAQEPAAPEENCPDCGADGTERRVGMGQKALAIGVFVLGSATFPTRQTVLRCRACGHEWPRTEAD
jgi:hypothetical protein